MSNFTKSIFYSGTVLAIGLIAIFTIYSTTVGQNVSVANIEPAAGVEFGSYQQTATEAITEIIEDAAAIDNMDAAATMEEATDMMMGATTTEETSDIATNMATDAKEMTMDAAEMTMTMDTTEELSVEIKAAAEIIVSEEMAEETDMQTMIEMESDAQAHEFDITEPAAGDAIIKEIEMKIGN